MNEAREGLCPMDGSFSVRIWAIRPLSNRSPGERFSACKRQGQGQTALSLFMRFRGISRDPRRHSRLGPSSRSTVVSGHRAWRASSRARAFSGFSKMKSW